MMKKSRKNKTIINYAEVGRRLGITRQYVGQLLNPKNKRKNPARLKAIHDLVNNELHHFNQTKAA